MPSAANLARRIVSCLDDRDGKLFRLGMVIALAVYTGAYLSHPTLPGNNPRYPEGWWGFWDQSRYLISASALAHGDFSVDSHRYPLGYALLAAPFTLFMRNHAFYFVNAVCLSASAYFFGKISEIFGVSKLVSLLLFVLGFASSAAMLDTLVVPWNTIPTMTYIYAALYISIREREPGRGGMALVGMCFALTVTTRPGDGFILIPIASYLAYRYARRKDILPALGEIIAGAATALVIIGLYACLYYRIYGLSLMPYMERQSQFLGYDYRYYFEKLYAMMKDPVPIYGTGRGFIQELPWIIVAIPSVIFGCSRLGTRWIAVIGVTATTVAVYTFYVDYTPINMWLYGVVHYYSLTPPILALAALQTVLICARRRRLLLPAVAIIALYALIDLRTTSVDEATVTVDDERTLTIKRVDRPEARVVTIAPFSAPNEALDFSAAAVIGGETLVHYKNFRIFNMGGTARLVSSVPMRGRDLVIRFSAPHGYSPSAPPTARVVTNHLGIWGGIR